MDARLLDGKANAQSVRQEPPSGPRLSRRLEQYLAIVSCRSVSRQHGLCGRTGPPSLGIP